MFVFVLQSALAAAGASSDLAARQAPLQSKPAVLRERVLAELPNAHVLRITGKVKVLDASTLAFEDGTQVTVATTIDAPALDQKALLDGKIYPAGRDAAEFLRKLIGEEQVRFFAWGEKEEKSPVRGLCFVGEKQLGMEMVRNGWAVARHSSMIPYEVFARENKRGLWRGEFVLPADWRKGERLKGEPADAKK